jgi:hypothetical protein
MSEQVIRVLNGLGENWAVCRNTRSFKEGEPSEYWKEFDRWMGEAFKLQVDLMQAAPAQPAGELRGMPQGLTDDERCHIGALMQRKDEGLFLTMNEELLLKLAALGRKGE